MKLTQSRLFYVVVFSITFAIGSTIGCSLKRPAQETPTPKSGTFEKSFFVDATGKPKRFLIGAASEAEVGVLGEAWILHNGTMMDHANIEFEITEQALLGKMINPSFPNNREKWETAIRIPISRHYYVENSKDSYGRKENQIIENSDRSHWSARPNFELDLANLAITKNSWNTTWFGQASMGVSDLEIDSEKNFMAFSLNVMDSKIGSRYGSLVRFNIMKFDHNPKFKRTPFSHDNYRYFNVLHYTGKKVEGDHPVLSAGHWDLSKDREIHLVNVPKQYVEMVKGLIEDWNTSLRKIGALPEGKKGFIPVVKERKHPFDLRYPSIYWVSDKRISSNSPLGVGMAHMDTLNGEILWGGITIWGGEIESYIQSSLTSGEALSNEKSLEVQKFLEKILNSDKPQSQAGLPTGFADSVARISEKTNRAQMQAEFKALSDSLSKQLERMNPQSLADKARIQSQLSPLSSTIEGLSAEATQVVREQVLKVHQSQITEMQKKYSSQNYTEIFKKLFRSAQMQRTTEKQADMPATPEKPGAKKPDLNQTLSSSVFCGDQTFSDIGLELGRAAAASGRDLGEITLAVLKDLIIHEYGHFLGLGHNFKENILPKPGSVPEKYRTELAAQHKNSLKNVSSVMGYKNARTEMMTMSEEIKPGFHDELVLRFLYRQEYATYDGGDEFQFHKIAEDGIIPAFASDNSKQKTTYFPQCNDWTASSGVDPFCNRWDRGSTASEIVTNYLSDLTKDLVRTLHAFTDQRGGRPIWDVEDYLWWKSYSHLGRVRVFYDYMRRKYEKTIDTFRQRESALYEFSNCAKTSQFQDKALELIFKKDPEFFDLCQANALAVNSLKDILEKDARDFSKIDHDNYVFPGGIDAGDVDFWTSASKAFGTWKELGIYPLKFMSLYTLLHPHSYLSWYHYDDPNYGYSYSSLYPFEFTESIASAVTKNLQFASLGNSDTTRMGQTVATLGWMQFFNYYNNEPPRFPKQFITSIRGQNVFHYSYAAIILKAVRKQNDQAKFVERFSGTVYDFMTDKSTTVEDQVYVLPGGEVLGVADGMFLLPVTKLKMFSDDEGYVIAFKVSYEGNGERDDKLAERSLRVKMKNDHFRVIDACITGGGKLNGLKHFFTTGTEFKGFELEKGATKDEVFQKFLNSVETNYELYYKSTAFKENKPKIETCRETLQGLGLIVSAAALSNGYWLPTTFDYLLK